jgi:predicted dehydrogenase
MKLGVLGMDSRIAQVVTAAVAGGDTVTIACDLDADDPTTCIPATVPRDVSWERLLDPGGCDAVLVAADRWSDRRADAVRSLAQAGRTLLLSHPLVLSMLWAYELDMIRTDSGARLIPLLPERLHPFIERLRTRIEAGLAGATSAGAIETITFERRLVDRSRAAVLAALARDVDLVRVLAGEPSRLSTLGGGESETAWAALAVGFSGPAQLPVRWQAVRGDRPGLRITAVHARGSCAVDIPDDPDLPWTWSDGRDETAPFEPGALMVDELHGRRPATGVPAAVWPDAARAVELAETVPRSLAKGRAIDLHQEEFSEIGTFRGTMASLGCGLVLAALLLLLLATLVGGVARAAGWQFGERIAGVWPQIVLAVLGVFLALQFLPLLVGAGRPAGDRPPAPPGRRRE